MPTPLGVGAELVDDFVDGLSVRMEGDTGEVELGCWDRPDGGAIGFVVGRGEQVVGEDGKSFGLARRSFVGAPNVIRPAESYRGGS